MTAADAKLCAEANAMPATLAELLLIEKKFAIGAMLSPEEASPMMGISPRQVRVQISAGNLRARRVSRETVLIHPDAIRAWQSGRAGR